MHKSILSFKHLQVTSPAAAAATNLLPIAIASTVAAGGAVAIAAVAANRWSRFVDARASVRRQQQRWQPYVAQRVSLHALTESTACTGQTYEVLIHFLFSLIFFYFLFVTTFFIS